jgi:hypothetical protein
MLVSDSTVSDDRQRRQPLPERSHRTCDLTVVAISRLDEEGEDRLFLRPKRRQHLVQALDEANVGAIANGVAEPATLLGAEHEGHDDRAAVDRRHVPVS